MASAGSIATTNRRDEMAAISSSSSPGELILKKLFAQFVVTAESKLKHVSTQPLVRRERKRDYHVVPFSPSLPSLPPLSPLSLPSPLSLSLPLSLSSPFLPQANPLIKYIQRGDDPTLDQLLASLKEVARFSLRSMLTTLFEWRKKLMKEIQSRTTWTVSTR